MCTIIEDMYEATDVLKRYRLVHTVTGKNVMTVQYLTRSIPVHCNSNHPVGLFQFC